MFGLALGRLGTTGSRQWSESALWPLGASSPGLWIDPSYSASQWQDSAGTTALSTVGAVLDSSNPVGLVLDRKGGLVLGPELLTGTFTASGAGASVVGSTIVFNSVLPGSGDNATHPFTWVSGKRYILSFDATGYTGTNTYAADISGIQNILPATSGNGRKTAIVISAINTSQPFVIREVYSVASNLTVTFSNISVREITGLHLSQSTSAARPVASARVNLLTGSEDFDGASWGRVACTVSANATTAPDGQTTADKYQEDATNGIHFTGLEAPPTVSGNVVASVYAKAAERTKLNICEAASTGARAVFDLSSGTILDQVSTTAAITDVGNGWFRCSITMTLSAQACNHVFASSLSSTASNPAESFQGVAGSGLYLWGAQIQIQPLGTYQRISTAAASYTAIGFPQYLKFDGVDDALSSATFPAGTLTSSMDCLIAVRRDSAASVALLYGGGGLVAGIIDGSASASNSGAGSPTMWVDGTQLAGGTSVTRNTLNVALTVGAWHIVEWRGLDLSAVTSIAVGNWGSGWQLNGALGEIQLFAAGQDANRDKARARMAAYFGVTLA